MKHVLIHFSELGDCTTPRVNLNGIHGLWVIMMCQGRYTSYSKSTFWQGMLMLMLGEAMHVWGQECIQKISVPPSQFFYEPKLTWKRKVLKETQELVEVSLIHWNGPRRAGAGSPLQRHPGVYCESDPGLSRRSQLQRQYLTQAPDQRIDLRKQIKDTEEGTRRKPISWNSHYWTNEQDDNWRPR